MTGYSIWLKGTKKKAEPDLFDKVPLLLPSSLNQVPESLVQQHDKDANARDGGAQQLFAAKSCHQNKYVVIYIVVADPPLDHNASSP